MFACGWIMADKYESNPDVPRRLEKQYYGNQ
jgi:hypothetical protein